MRTILGFMTAGLLSLTAWPAMALRCEAVFTNSSKESTNTTLKSEIISQLQAERTEVQNFLEKIVTRHHTTVYTSKEQAVLREVEMEIQKLLKNNDYDFRIIQGLPRALGPHVQVSMEKLFSIEKIRTQFASHPQDVTMAFLMHPNASAWEMNISFLNFNHALMYMTSTAGKSPAEQSVLAQSMLSLSEGVFYMKAREKEAQGIADLPGLRWSELKSQKDQVVQEVVADLGWTKVDLDFFKNRFQIMKDPADTQTFHAAFNELKDYIKSHPDRFLVSEYMNDALYKMYKETDDATRVYLLATTVGKTSAPQRNIDSLSKMLNLEVWRKTLSGTNYRLLKAKEDLKGLL